MSTPNPVKTYYALPAEDGGLDPAQVREVLDEYPDGFTNQQLAQRFGVSSPQMSAVLQILKNEGLISSGGGSNTWSLVARNGKRPPPNTPEVRQKATQAVKDRAIVSGRWGGTEADRRRIRIWAIEQRPDLGQSMMGQLKTAVVEAYYEAHPDAPRLDGVTEWPQTKTRKTSRPRKRKGLVKKPVPAKRGTDEIEVTRDYRHPDTGLMVRMHLNGIAEVSVPKQPKVRLDVAQLRALAKIADRIEEMNRVMGH